MDAAAADAAAGHAEGYATSARASADQAALDAEAARAAATEAEQAAKDARAAADRADAAATEAEEAAKDADKYAKEAQEAADRAERAENAQQIETGTVFDEVGGSIGNMFYVVDHYNKIGEPETVERSGGCDGWWDKLFYNGDCTMTVKIRFTAVLDVYICTAEDLDLEQYRCPSGATMYVDEVKTKELSTKVTHTITIAEFQKDIDPIDILFGSWIKCAQKLTPGGAAGDGSGCAWAIVDVASLFAGKILRPIADAVKAADAAARTGIGFAEAWKGLRAAGLTEAAVEGIGAKILNTLIEWCTTKKPLRAAAAAASGDLPCKGMIAYNSTTLSSVVFQARLANGWEFRYGGNVAVAHVPGWNNPKTGDYVIGFSNGTGAHSEDRILAQLEDKGVSPSKIKELYSERSPCDVCRPKLEAALEPGTPISWSVPNGPGSSELLKRMILRAKGQ